MQGTRHNLPSTLRRFLLGVMCVGALWAACLAQAQEDDALTGRSTIHAQYVEQGEEGLVMTGEIWWERAPDPVPIPPFAIPSRLIFLAEGSGTYIGLTPEEEADWCLGTWSGSWQDLVSITVLDERPDGTLTLRFYLGGAEEDEYDIALDEDCEPIGFEPWYGIGAIGDAGDLEDELLLLPGETGTTVLFTPNDDVEWVFTIDLSDLIDPER